MRMKRGRLPLTALRSFEAAGRLLSFSHAAEELFVSQAAISRQIRELETFIGTPLFERLHQRVVLTEAGRSLLEKLTASFDEIDLGLANVMAESTQPLLRVSVEPTFANGWLVPRLNQFGNSTPMSTSRSTRTCGSWNFALTRQNCPSASGGPRDHGRGRRRSTSLTSGLHLSSHPPCSRPAHRFTHQQTCATTLCCTIMTGRTGQSGSKRSASRTSLRTRVPFILQGRRPFRPRSSATASLSQALQ